MHWRIRGGGGELATVAKTLPIPDSTGAALQISPPCKFYLSTKSRHQKMNKINKKVVISGRLSVNHEIGIVCRHLAQS